MPVVFNNNQVVEPKQKYTYDALYRLIEAEGREHTALNNPDYYKDPYAFKQSAFIHLTDPNDDNKLANYTRYFTYDNAGNLTTIQHVAADSQRSFTREINVDATSNRWLPANMGTNPDYSLYYDANGNITELEHLQALTWNYRDNINSALLVERPSETDDAEYYIYDSTGQRVRKVRETYINPGTTEYEEKLYLGGVEIKRIRSNTTTILERTTLHVMDDTRRIATVHNWSNDTNLREIDSTADLNINKIRYQYGNHLDSASLELDPTGNIISYEEYFPYGDTSFIAGTNQKEVKLKEYRYTGKERDDATGLYYYGARYYAPWVGRWMSCDPLFREQPMVYEKPKAVDEEESRQQEQEYNQKLYDEGLNLYGYVKGNPVMFNDFNGYEMKEPEYDNTNPYWIVRTGDNNLTNIVNQINRKYDMDILIEDVLRSNPQIKDKNKIQIGDKINLPFLKIEKLYAAFAYNIESSVVIPDRESNTKYSFTGRGVSGWLIEENNILTNTLSKRKVKLRNYEFVATKTRIADRKGLNWSGPGIIGAFGKFKSMDEAKQTILGKSYEGNLGFVFEFTLGYSTKSSEAGSLFAGRWFYYNVGVGFGVYASENYSEKDSSFKDRKVNMPQFRILGIKFFSRKEVIYKGNRK